MSASGLRLRLERPSPVAQGSSLTLVLGSASRTVEVKAHVVWSRSHSTVHELGLKFDEADHHVRAALFNLAWNGPDAAGPVTSLALSGAAA